MTNLTVQTIDSTFVVDSRLIAAELGITHKSFKETIRTYKMDFEEFGNLAVHSEGVKGTSSYSEFLYLTEDQSYLSLTYSNNTPEVRRAKKNLVHAFKAAREASVVKAPSNMIEAMEVALAALKEAEATKLLLAAADHKVKEMQPKVEEYNLLCERGKDIKVGELSKILGVKNMGPIKLFKFLKAQKVLIEKSNLPYAEYIHCFNVVRKLNSHNGDVHNVPLVNTEGISLIIKKLKAAGHIVNSITEAA